LSISPRRFSAFLRFFYGVQTGGFHLNLLFRWRSTKYDTGERPGRIPEPVNGKPVDSIGDRAFCNNKIHVRRLAGREKHPNEYIKELDSPFEYSLEVK
jgi:hypothetical protein